MTVDGKILDLVDNVVSIVESSDNKANARLWEPQPVWARDCWRGIPKNNPEGAVPFIIEPAKHLWSLLAGFDFARYYDDPTHHLSGILKTVITKHRVLRDRSWFNGEIAPWVGWVFELSLFGAHVEYRGTEEPLIGEPRVLEDTRSLGSLKQPDFYASGLMPRMIEFYEIMREAVGGKLRVTFPTWARGPFPVAIHLRGMQALLMDIFDRPQFVHDLMRFIVDTEKAWLEQRARYTGEPLEPALFYNDEIGAPTISPSIYRDFVFPYEKELADFRGGVTYVHSCNNTTRFLPSIKTLPGLRLMHVSPWTDLGTAIEILAPDIALDICLHPLEDVQMASEEEMRQKLRRVRMACEGHARFSIRADTLRLLTNLQDDLSRILLWRKVAEEELGQRTSSSVGAIP